jgi:hypothetical protein
MTYAFRTTEPRPNGLPPLVRTWEGIKKYKATDRPAADAHVVLIMSEDDQSIWLIDTLERMHDLMRLMQVLELPVNAYSVLKPLPAFQEL